MLNQQQGFGAFPNGAYGMSSGFQSTSAPAKRNEETFSGFGNETKTKESGGFSLFGLFAKSKQETLDDLVPDNPWLNNQFFREAVPEEAEAPESTGMVVDQFNLAYRTLI